MKEFINETPSELLTQLIDNELDQSKEANLYDALSSSSELQDELRQHIKIREAIKKDTESFTPPAETVNSIFNNLGYLPPPPSGMGNLKKKTLPFTFFKRVAVPALLLLIGTYAAYTVLDSDQENIKSKHSIQNKINKNVPIAITEGSKEVIAENKISKNYSFSKAIKTNKNKIESINSVEAANINQINNKAENIVSTSQELNSESTLKTQIDFSKPLQNSNFAIQSSFNARTFDRLDFNYNILNQSRYALIAKSTINSNSNIGLPFSIGFLFDITNEFRLGGEIGNQSFDVMVSSNDDTELIHQTRNGNWIAAFLRYDSKLIEFMNVQPFVQAGIGFGDYGNSKWIVKYSAGFEYQLLNTGLGFVVGYENSDLHYSTIGNSYNSSSQGIILGVTYSGF